MTVTKLTSTNLHEPVLPLVRPVFLVVRAWCRDVMGALVVGGAICTVLIAS